MTNPPCSKCGHWRMYLLSNYLEEDVNDTPAHDGWGSPTWGNMGRGGSINWFYFVGWLFNTVRGSVTVKAKRDKLRKLREEVLPRAPKTLVCPKCFTHIERV